MVREVIADRGERVKKHSLRAWRKKLKNVYSRLLLLIHVCSRPAITGSAKYCSCEYTATQTYVSYWLEHFETIKMTVQPQDQHFMGMFDCIAFFMAKCYNGAQVLASGGVDLIPSRVIPKAWNTVLVQLMQSKGKFTRNIPCNCKELSTTGTFAKWNLILAHFQRDEGDNESATYEGSAISLDTDRAVTS